MQTKLRHRILEDGRYQRDIAAAASMPGSRLSELVMGKRVPTMHETIRLAKVLRVNPDELLGWESGDEDPKRIYVFE